MDVAKETKPRAPKPPASVEELVERALTLAATNPKAKWTGASGAVLFNTKDANHEAAVAECTNAAGPLLKRVDKGGALTAAGFERIAGALPVEEARAAYDRLRDEAPDDQVGTVARVMAARLAPGERIEFIQGVIRRTPLAATELTPLLEDAVAAEKVEQEARIADATKRRAADEAAKAALERAKELIEERQRNRRAALKREYEAEGGAASDLGEPEPRPAPERAAPKAVGTEPAPRLRTAEETDFRRDVAAQLAASWRATWELNKPESREFLESAMWNISGLRLFGEPKGHVAYSGKLHESVPGVFPGDTVRVTRPGWALDEDGGEFVVLKAVVEK